MIRSNASVRVAIAALDRERLIEFATASFATPLLTRLFNMQPNECVLKSECIDDWIDRGTHMVAERDGRVLGLLTVAPFDADGMELGDANLLEIGLLCSAEPGLGRLMLAFALREADQRNCDGIVLELLAGRYNKAAFQLYQSFGFEHERRLDATDDDADFQPSSSSRPRAPRLRRCARELKNEFGGTLFYMSLRRDAARSPFLTSALLERVLQTDAAPQPP
jgi:GNAT superfamily N-acetyltransferase